MEELLNLIPQPKNIQYINGYFDLTRNTDIKLDINCNYDDFEASEELKNEIYKLFSVSLSITKAFNKSKGKFIYITRGNLLNEEYNLVINENSIEITGGGSSGIYYGIQTLIQIFKTKGVRLPNVNIEDGPYFKFRGFYHDVTRGKVPTLDTLKELADRASHYKINQIQLYIEHSFAFKDMSEVWSESDPLTAEEIIIFDEYCRKKHIELVPSIATFGHLYHALVSESFNELCEIENSKDQPFTWYDDLLHHTLNISNPKSIKFVQDMLEQFIPLFSSKKFNICADETFDLGNGKNKELADKEGKGKLYIDFLLKIIDSVKKYDKEVMFWGDIILHHPEYLPQIPKDVICLNWNYTADVKEDGVKTISQYGVLQVVCPGVSGWNRLMNDMDRASLNISKMISYGKKYGAIGVLNTDWGDYGHINLFANSIPGMIFGADLSWNPTESEQFNFDEEDSKISILEYDDESGKIVGYLRDISRSSIMSWRDAVDWRRQRKEQGFLKSELYQQLKDVSKSKIIDENKNIEDIEKKIANLFMKLNKKNCLDFQEFMISAKGIVLVNVLSLIIKKYDFKQDIKDTIFSPQELAVEFEFWLRDYKAIWRKRNKESELFRIKNVLIEICKVLRTINK